MDEKIIAWDGTEFENEDAAKAAGYGQCDDCGAWVPNSDLISTVDNDLVCGDCRDDHYATCYYCGELFDLNGGGLEVDGHTYCDEECAERDGNFFCQNCEEWHPQRDYAGDLRGDSDYPLCNWCVTNCDFGTCDNCGTIYPYDELYADDYGDSYCEDCDRNREEDDVPGERKSVHDYGYKPEPVFFSEEKPSGGYDTPEALTLGVELEISDSYNQSEALRDLSEWTELYVKHDGSVDGAGGMEIVTHPATLDYHLRDFKWATLCDEMVARGYKSHNAGCDCGLHVHVGRRQLGANSDAREATAAKLVLLVDRFWGYLLPFSRRRESSLERWARRPNTNLLDTDTPQEMRQKALDTSEAGRYVALNLCNDNTVEFRLFRGTLKANTLLASLELVSNLCEFARAHSVEDLLESKWTDVAYYKHYSELDAYLDERGLATDDESKVTRPKKTPPHTKLESPEIGQRVVILVGGNAGELGTLIMTNTAPMANNVVLLDNDALGGAWYSPWGPSYTNCAVYPLSQIGLVVSPQPSNDVQSRAVAAALDYRRVQAEREAEEARLKAECDAELRRLDEGRSQTYVDHGREVNELRIGDRVVVSRTGSGHNGEPGMTGVVLSTNGYDDAQAGILFDPECYTAVSGVGRGHGLSGRLERAEQYLRATYPDYNASSYIHNHICEYGQYIPASHLALYETGPDDFTLYAAADAWHGKRIVYLDSRRNEQPAATASTDGTAATY